MIIMNLKNMPRSILLDDGKTLLLSPSQKNYKLPKEYQNDKVLEELSKKGMIRIIKDKDIEKEVEEEKTIRRERKKGMFRKNLVEGEENE